MVKTLKTSPGLSAVPGIYDGRKVMGATDMEERGPPDIVQTTHVRSAAYRFGMHGMRP
jgi:hypothetical protein